MLHKKKKHLVMVSIGIILFMLATTSFNSSSVDRGFSDFDYSAAFSRAMNNFFTCSDFRISPFGDGPACLFKGNGLDLIYAWSVLGSWIIGIVFILFGGLTIRTHRVNASVFDKTLNRSLIGAIVLLCSFSIFFLGEWYAKNALVDDITGRRFGFDPENNWFLRDGNNVLMLTIAASTFLRAAIGYTTIRAFQWIERTFSENSQMPMRGFVSFSKVEERGHSSQILFLLSTAIVGVPIWITTDQAIQDIVAASGFRGSLFEFYAGQYFMLTVLLLDIARTTALIYLVKRLAKRTSMVHQPRIS